MNRTAIFLPSLHKFEKIASKTTTNNESYDLMRCKQCGLEGRQYTHENCVTVLRKYSEKQIHLCNLELPNTVDPFLNQNIQITKCNAFGAVYNNCKPKSFHKVVAPPFGHRNGDRGVFVKGVDGPVKVFFDEFVFVNHLPNKFSRTK